MFLKYISASCLIWVNSCWKKGKIFLVIWAQNVVRYNFLWDMYFYSLLVQLATTYSCSAGILKKLPTSVSYEEAGIQISFNFES